MGRARFEPRSALDSNRLESLGNRSLGGSWWLEQVVDHILARFTTSNLVGAAWVLEV